MDELRFAHLVRDLEVDDAAREAEMRTIAPADRSYVILFSARSGSTWLSAALTATKRLGVPEEYINPDFVATVAKAVHARTPEHLLEMLKRRRKSPNGVFGMETRQIDIELLDFDVFRAAFGPETIFFHLWRENIIAQGISLYRAVATQHYHSNAQGGGGSPPPFDAEAMTRWIRHVANTESANVSVLQRLGAAARHLRYEDIVADRVKTLETFAHVLAVPFAPGEFDAAPDNELSKLADAWSLEAETRYRLECSAQVARFEGERLVKNGVPPRPSMTPEAGTLLEAYTLGTTRGQAGRSPRNNPHPRETPEWQSWWQGWQDGWDDQPYRAPAALRDEAVPAAFAPAASAPPPPAASTRAARPPVELALAELTPIFEDALPAEAPGAVFTGSELALPNLLHDFAALRLRDVLLHQYHARMQGGLLELGLSRGRLTGLLFQATRNGASTALGIDPSDGRFGALLRPFLLQQDDAAAVDRWLVPHDGLASVTAEGLRGRMGGGARFIAIDATHARGQIPLALTLAEALITEGGCIVLNDFLGPLRIEVTEALLGFLHQTRQIAPFALLPGRLLLAPVAACAEYRAIIEAATVADAASKAAAVFRAARERDDASRLRQMLAGTEITILC